MAVRCGAPIPRRSSERFRAPAGARPQAGGHLCGRVGGNINPAGERQSLRQAIRRAALREKEQSEAQSPRVGAAAQPRGNI